jgi:UDP-N-acetylmuramoyl-tripeptide--D-alanyl-D-alanine ligase
MTPAIIEQLYAHFEAHPQVTTDSRHCPEGSIFFALKGANFDGNQYAAASLAAGCAAVVVDDVTVLPTEFVAARTAYGAPAQGQHGPYFLVDDVLSALQQLAAHHRAQFRTWSHPVPVIGITGTNGKTTTKELLNAVLSRKYRVAATVGNLNNQIGVPLTLLQVTPDHEIAIIEMGANHPIDIAELCDIVHPDCGLITTVAKGHILGFGSFEGVVAAKTKLYDSLRHDSGLAFVNENNLHLMQHVAGLATVGYAVEATGKVATSLPKGFQPGTPGIHEEEVLPTSPVVVGRVRSASPLLKLSLNILGEEVDIDTHLVGAYNLVNMTAAAAVGCSFGVPTADIVAALSEYVPSNMRSQLLPLNPGLTAILDAYNANPDSMKAALQSFALYDVPNKQLILGDMGELGAESQAEHLALLRYLIQTPFNNILLVGHEMESAFRSLNHDELFAMGTRHTVRCYPTVQDLCADTETLRYLLGTVLIKGSRSNALERVVAVLKEDV